MANVAVAAAQLIVREHCACLAVFLIACTGLADSLVAQAAQSPAPAAQLSVGSPIGNVARIGVNLGHGTSWGAEKLLANVLRNPGLEAGLDGSLLVVGRMTGHLLIDDSVWTSRSEGFWTGARYDILSGVASGKSGRIVDDHPSPGVAPTPTVFQLAPKPAGVRKGDVIALQGEQDNSVIPLWWTDGLVRALPGQARPGSEGRQSARLQGSSALPAALIHHFDGITARAGNLLPVNGRWQLSLWARAITPGSRLVVTFGRHGTAPWLQHKWEPSAAWQELKLMFVGHDSRNPGPLKFSISANGIIDVDDIALTEPGAGAGGFRSAVVETLRRMRPGYLRDWQGQLGDTTMNRVATPFARHPVRYRPGAHEWKFPYSLEEFAALSAAVDARPWFVLPTTSTPKHARAFGAALRRLWKRHGFDELVVEHGNEHWNPIFRPAGILDPTTLAQVAERSFRALREGAGPDVPLHRVLGVQFVRPETIRALTARNEQIDGIAVAPYFLYKMAAGESTRAALQRALDEPANGFDKVRSLLPNSVAMDVYEVNLHTTHGDAGEAERNAVVTSAAAGAALARRLMQGIAAGVQRQAAYVLSGFDTPTGLPQRTFVRLFGLTRDLTTPRRMRATGEALSRLNALDWREIRRARCTGDACSRISALAFNGGQWAVVSALPDNLLVSWPCKEVQRVGWLDGSQNHRADDPAAAQWFENSALCLGGQAHFKLPAHSFMTVVPKK